MTNEELCILIQQGTNVTENTQKLYEQNLGLIRKIAKNYLKYSEMDDLLQEGYFSIKKASEEWHPELEFKFTTFASKVITRNLQRYIYNTALIRIPDNERTMIGKYQKAISDSDIVNLRDDGTIIMNLQINQSTLNRIKRNEKMLNTVSLDKPFDSESDEGACLLDVISDSKNEAELIEDKIFYEQRASELWSIVDELEPMQAEFIREHYKDNLSIKTISEIHNYPESKIRYYESQGLRNLRKKHNRERLAPYMNIDRIFSKSVHHSGLESFLTSWTSSVEDIAIRLLCDNGRSENG